MLHLSFSREMNKVIFIIQVNKPKTQSMVSPLCKSPFHHLLLVTTQTIALKILCVSEKSLSLHHRQCAGNVTVILPKFFSRRYSQNEEKIVEFSVTDYYQNKLNYLQCTSLEIYYWIRVGKQIQTAMITIFPFFVTVTYN